jgi:hypothetical protein
VASLVVLTTPAALVKLASWAVKVASVLTA